MAQGRCWRCGRVGRVFELDLGTPTTGAAYCLRHTLLHPGWIPLAFALALVTLFGWGVYRAVGLLVR